nr:uncharacterized protein LOC113823006 isoform X3 [Penaeus vannamei]
MVAINYKSLFQSAQRNDNQGSHQSIHGGEASSVAGVGQGRERAVLATFTRSLAHSHAGGSSWRFNSLSRMGYFRSVSRGTFECHRISEDILICVGEVHSQQVASEAKKCLQKSMPHHLRNICPSKNDFMDGKRRKSDGATSGE